MDHAEAGPRMRSRGQPIVAFALVAALALGAWWADRNLAVHEEAGPAGGNAPSGAWFCPHGGGPEWNTTIYVANPGSHPATVRLTTIGAGRASEPRVVDILPGSSSAIPVDSDGRASSTTVEYFGGWVAAGWVAHAGGAETGVTAEPCTGSATTRWLAADGVTLQGFDSYLIVMNPFDARARLSVTLYAAGAPPIRDSGWKDLSIQGHHARVFHLNEKRLEEQALGAEVTLSAGRVAVSSLIVAAAGGARATLATPGDAPGRAISPSGGDQGAGELVLFNPADTASQVSGTLRDRDGPHPLGGLTDAQVAPGAARTAAVASDGPRPSATDVSVADGTPGAVIVRRVSGKMGDPGGSVSATAPASAWVVFPTVGGAPSHPGLFVTNVGEGTATITLRALDGSGLTATMRVGPGASAAAPQSFVASVADVPVLVSSDPASIVAAGASSSLGRLGVSAFAFSLGVAVPVDVVPGGTA